MYFDYRDYGSSDSFPASAGAESAVVGLAGGIGLAAGALCFIASAFPHAPQPEPGAPLPATAGFPTVKYLRILSRRLLPIPRIATRSSTLLNAPYDFRICRIFSAVAGPIPGTSCNSSDVAELRLMGLSGGFFVAEEGLATASAVNNQTSATARQMEGVKERGNLIIAVYFNDYIIKSITTARPISCPRFDCPARRRFRFGRRAWLALRFARDCQQRRSACSQNRNTFER